MKRLLLLALLTAATAHAEFSSGASGSSRSTYVPPLSQGTAFFIVQDTQLSRPPLGFLDYSLYVVNPVLPAASVEANTNPVGVKLAYTDPLLIPEYGPTSPFYNGLRAAADELGEDNVYWHYQSGPNAGERLEWSEDVAWYVKPSAELADALSTYFLAEIDPYFDGVYSDDTTADIPEAFWTAWKLTGEVVDGDRAAQEVLFDAHVAAWGAAMKAGLGTSKLFIGNTTGDTFSWLDGITIESFWILSRGGATPDAWAVGRFQAAKALWAASANKYAGGFYSVAWEYPLNLYGLCYQGTIQ